MKANIVIAAVISLSQYPGTVGVLLLALKGVFGEEGGLTFLGEEGTRIKKRKLIPFNTTK